MDPYAVLRLPKTADTAEIKDSFRRLALEHHPDRQTGASEQQQASAATKFADIKEAYETLADDKRRAAYDRHGHSRPASGSGTYSRRSTASYGYDPFQRADWTKHTRRTRRPGSSFYQSLGRVAAGMTRADGLFHLTLAGILVFGGLFADRIGDFLWYKSNEGRGFERIEQLAAQKREAMAAASASEDGEAMPAADQPAIADSSQQSAAVHGLQQRPATASAPPEQPEARNPSLSFASGGLQQHAPMPPSSIGPAAAAAAAGDRQAHTGSMKISPPQQLQGGSAAPGQAGESQHLQLGTGRPQAAQPQTHLEPSAARVQP